MEGRLTLLAVFLWALVAGGCQEAWHYRVEMAKAQIAQARSLIEKKEWEKAAEHLRQASRHDPFDSDIWLLLGDCYREIGKPEWARDMYKKTLELYPASALAHYGLGLLDWKKNWDMAYNRFVAAYQLDPVAMSVVKNYPFQHALAHYFYHSGCVKREIRTRQIILELFPGEAGKMSDLGFAYNNAKDYSSTVALFEKALNSKNKDRLGISPHLGLIWAYFNLGLYQKAFEVLGKAWESDHNNGLLRYYAGLLAKENGDYDSAQEHWEHAAIHSDELKDNRALVALAELQALKGNQTAASQYLELALTIENSESRNALSKYYEKQGDLKKAISFALKASEFNPDKRHACRLAKLYARVGDNDQTVKYLEICEKSLPPNECGPVKGL